MTRLPIKTETVRPDVVRQLEEFPIEVLEIALTLLQTQRLESEPQEIPPA